MTSNDYKSVILNAFVRIGDLTKQKADIDVELTRLRQFARATLPMLSDEDKAELAQLFNKVWSLQETEEKGLTDAIRDLLMASPKQWFTVTSVRDALQLSGFDFSGYTSNPLSSISATLKRLTPKEIEQAEIDGVAGYRWRSTKANKLLARKRRQAKLEAMYGTASIDDIIEEADKQGTNDPS